MIAIASHADRYSIDNPWSELDKFEPIRHRRGGEFPVRSQASRTRGRMRGRASATARRKAREFLGINRRGRMRRGQPFA